MSVDEGAEGHPAEKHGLADYNARTMSVRFTKMHGIGNDYVYIDTFAVDIEAPADLARRVSDRHFGVGGDGLILIRPPEDAANHCRMEMYNADGSRAEMCGNGVRCVGKFVHDRGIAPYAEIRVETDAGLKILQIERDAAGRADRITVDMGAPGLRRAEVPIVDGGDPSGRAIGVRLEAAGRVFPLTAVSMGNPHAVCRLDRVESPSGDLPSLAELPLATLGPPIESHSWFPQRVNVEFVVPLSPSELDFRVWERGSGETLACGTGACAAVVAGALEGWCEREAVVHLRGGDLVIRWDGVSDGGTVYMTGGATEVFTGELA